MNRKAIIACIIAAVIVVAGGTALLAGRHKSPKPVTQNTMQNMNMADTDATKTAPVATSSVTIQNFAFAPANITVKKGTTVTWTNKDSAAHTVTETDSQAGPDSGDLNTGKSYSFTYTAVGTFKYHCAIHPDMVGTVTVTE